MSINIFKGCSSVSNRICNFTKRTLFFNSLLTCAIIIVLTGLLALIPYALDLIDSDTVAMEADEAVIQTQYTKTTLLICIAVSVPILISLILDWQKLSAKSRIERNEWLSTLLLVGSLVGPNVILFFYLTYGDDPYYQEEPDDPSAAAFVQYILFKFQYPAIIGSMLSSMFGHTYFDFKAGSSAAVTFSVERRSIYYLLTVLLQQALAIISFSRGSSASERKFKEIFSWLEVLVGIFALIQLLVLIGQMMSVLIKQMVGWRFTSHYHMSDFFRLLALLLFVVAYLLINIAYGSYFEDPSEQSDEQSSAFLLLQLALIYFLTVIPTRSFMLEAQIKQEKLEARLNLIRYVSHEMRTPLNTASMGLGMIMSEMKAIQRDLNAVTSTTSDCIDITSNNQCNTPKHSLQNKLDHSGKNQTLQDPYNPYNLVSLMGWTVNDFMTVMKNLSNTKEPLSEVVDTVEQVNESCKVAISTLDDLLTFDKLDENKLLIELDEVNPWEFVKQTSKPFEINARTANVRFKIECADEHTGWSDLWAMKVDQFKLSQVMRNLMSNALKFTPENGLVTVKIEKVTKTAPLVNGTSSVRIAALGSAVHPVHSIARITVEDSGAGISHENQKKLFGQYVQFNAAKLQNGKGSGLGLWITKSIVAMHQGVIGVKSDGEGCGSTFFVELPLYRSNRINLGLTPIAQRNSIDDLEAGLELHTEDNDRLRKETCIGNESSGILVSGNEHNSAVNSGFSFSGSSSGSTRWNSKKFSRTKPQVSSSVVKKTSNFTTAFAETFFRPKNIRSEDRANSRNDNSFVSAGTSAGGSGSSKYQVSFMRSHSMSNENTSDDSPFPQQDYSGNLYNLNLNSQTPPPVGVKTSVKMNSLDALEDMEHLHFSAVSRDNQDHKFILSGAFVPALASATAGVDSGNRNIGTFLNNTVAVWDRSMSYNEESPRRNLYNRSARSVSIDVDSNPSSPSKLSPKGSSSPSGMFCKPQPLCLKQHHNIGAGTIYEEQDEDLSSIKTGTPLSLIGSPKVATDRHNNTSPVPAIEPKNLRLSPPASSENKSDCPNSTVALSANSSPVRDTADKENSGHWDNGLRFLVVDDAASNRKMSSRLLRSQGHSVEEAKDGSECVQLVLGPTRSQSIKLNASISNSASIRGSLDSIRNSIASHAEGNSIRDAQSLRFLEQKYSIDNMIDIPDDSRIKDFDVVLLDDNMPQMTGPEAANVLRQEGYKGMVFGVTGDATAEAKERFLSNGADEVFVKPLNVKALQEIIQKHTQS